MAEEDEVHELSFMETVVAALFLLFFPCLFLELNPILIAIVILLFVLPYAVFPPDDDPPVFIYTENSTPKSKPKVKPEMAEPFLD